MRTGNTWIMLLAAAVAVPCLATNYYVAASGSTPTEPWTNWAWAHTNLIEVVARCRDGDTVYVTNNSTYYLTNQVSISYAINLRSWAPDGGLDPDTTILDGNYPNTTNRLFFLNNYGAWLRGFTLTNGCFWSTSTVMPWAGGGAVSIARGNLTNCVISGSRNHHNYDGSANGGGAIYLGGGSGRSGTVWNCRIIGNTSTNNGGGGVKVTYGGPWLLANCVLAQNDTTNAGGGGLNAYLPADLELRDCQIASNVSRLGGGGIVFTGGGRLVRCVINGNLVRLSGGGGAYLGHNTSVRNCSIHDNVCLASGSSIGGGLYFTSSSNGLVENCTIYGNTASYGGGIAFYTATGQVDNCVVWSNTAAISGSNYWVHSSSTAYFTNCCAAPDPAAYGSNCFATNCLVADPLFAGLADNNVRLSPLSPCVNAGINRAWMAGEHDLDGFSRVDHFMRVVDMGAYEFYQHGTLFKVW